MELSFSTTYLHTDWENSEPGGQCDLTGAYVPYKDLIKEMVWAGNSLIWSGRMIFKDFYIEPNPAECPAPVYKDPQPLPHMRPSYWIQNNY